MQYAIVAACAALCIQIVDLLYHRPNFQAVPPPGMSSDAVRHYRRYFRSLSGKRHDNILAPLVYLRVLLWIFAANVVFHEADNIFVDALMVLFVAGRFRSLQEVGHHAAHGSLCPNRRLGEIMTNILYQFPAFMPEIRARHHIHVVTHHRSVNMPHDPDLKELVDTGWPHGEIQGMLWISRGRVRRHGLLFTDTLRARRCFIVCKLRLVCRDVLAVYHSGSDFLSALLLDCACFPAPLVRGMRR
jgi:Fatty acid desaturase